MFFSSARFNMHQKHMPLVCRQH